MNRNFHFETPDDIMNYIRTQGKQIFKFTKAYEGIITTHMWGDGRTIVIYWGGEVPFIHSMEELFTMYKKGTIFMKKEKVLITYNPFVTVNFSKLTPQEYQFLENVHNEDFALFDEIMKTVEAEQKFFRYLEEKEKEKQKEKKKQAKKEKDNFTE